MRKEQRAKSTVKLNVPVQEVQRVKKSKTEASIPEKEVKERKLKWHIPYSSATVDDVEMRLGSWFSDIKVVSVQEMLEIMKYEAPHFITNTKNVVYQDIAKFIRVEAYGRGENLKEASINDLVYCIISTVLDDVMRKTPRKSLRLLREKEIRAPDAFSGGIEEFVTMDYIQIADKRYVLVIEAKATAIERATNQCFLSMKDMWDTNGAGEVYGFTTTGRDWQMYRYDGVEFCYTDVFRATFLGMEKEKSELWMRDYSVVIDCLVAALQRGGVY